MNEIQRYLNTTTIHDGVLKEFVIKGLWTSAIKSCEDGIEKRKKEISTMENLIECMKFEREEKWRTEIF